MPAGDRTGNFGSKMAISPSSVESLRGKTLSRTIRGLVSVTVLTAGCLSLGGCLGLPEATGPLNVTAAPPAKPAATNKNVDDVTRRILQAAGLDPSDPSQPKEIGRNVAGVVQVRYQGRNYGTALARPQPGQIQFTEPNLVAAMLGGPSGKTRLAAALKGPLVDIDSRDCRVNHKHDRRARKALRRPRICPSPTGAIWADLNRREMVVELKMASEYAALVRAPSADDALGDAGSISSPIPTPAAAGSVNLFADAGSDQPAVESSQPAAAPISLRPPVQAVAAADLAVATSAPSSPWDALLAPTRTASQKPEVVVAPTQPAAQAPPSQLERKVVLIPPAAASAPQPQPMGAQILDASVSAPIQASEPSAQVVTISSSPDHVGLPSPVLAVSSYSAPSYAIVGSADDTHPRLFTSSNPVRVVDDSYTGDRSVSFNNVSVISGAYQPRSSGSFRQ
ncbi:hypothetical protein ACVIGB_000535 [Bradyrhizobium sp. USDA 4341]